MTTHESRGEERGGKETKAGEGGGEGDIYVRRGVGGSPHLCHAMFFLLILGKAALEKGTHPALLPASRRVIYRARRL
jgi:hypothetical protein